MIATMSRVLFLVVLAAGCAGEEEELVSIDDVPREGEVVDPPFDVAGEAEGLLLVWFDGEGLHTASRRSEIPEAHREAVRVDDLNLAPEERLDPELVYVADMRAERRGGYRVRRMPRDTFDALVSAAEGETNEPSEPVAEAPDQPSQGAGEGDIIIYGASWCGACRSAAAYLRSRDIPFVERDIEREPGARDAMMAAARRAGVRTNGIPVIDVRGQVLAGFDRAALDRAISSTAI
jgi:glutaredoxin